MSRISLQQQTLGHWQDTLPGILMANPLGPSLTCSQALESCLSAISPSAPGPVPTPAALTLIAPHGIPSTDRDERREGSPYPPSYRVVKWGRGGGSHRGRY